MGSVLRYLTVLGLGRLLPSKAFPWSILVANVVGSLIIGYLAAWSATRDRESTAWLLLATGVLGGYTTFSTFSLDTLTLLQSGRHAAALINVVASVLLALAAAAAGFKLAHSIHG